MGQRNILTEVVKTGFCIGCGVCAGVCPSKNLVMKWNEFGEYNPQEKGTCLENCSLCMDVCPFMNGNENEDALGRKLFNAAANICHTKETGYYLSCHVGYSYNREVGASGGMVTWLLEALLKQGFVDKVICVAPTGNPEALFQYRVMNKPEEVRGSAGSAYYPIHLSDVLGYIKENPGRYAITTLPCFGKGLRLAAEKHPLLKQRVRFILGLVCGQLKSSFYTCYISFLAGVNEPLKQCYYRGKDTNQPASNFTFTCEGVSGKTGSIRWNEGVAQVWTSRWFTPLACNFCDDVFAEVADATFMDAWLPQYAKDPKGTSLVLVRNPELISLLEETTGEGASLEPIPVEDIIQSQSGVLKVKRHHLAFRLHKAIAKGKEIPEKRVNPDRFRLPLLVRKEIEIMDNIQSLSRSMIPGAVRGRIPLKETRSQVDRHLSALDQVRKSMQLVRLPFRILRKIRKVFGGS